MLRVDDYNTWLETAEPGDEVVYYQTTRLPIPEYALGRYRQIMSRVYQSSVDRQVLLLTKRVPTGRDGRQLAYVARRVSPDAPEYLFPKEANHLYQ